LESRAKPVRVVATRVGLRQRLRELWESRELIVFLVRKEIKVKYKNSVLGLLWSMLNPAFTLMVYFFVFQIVLHNGVPQYAIYLMAGLLPWNLFQTAMMSGTSSIVDNSGIVKKVAFPREVLAIASVGTAFMFFVFQATVMALFMAGFMHPAAWGELWLLLPALAGLMVFAAAMTVFLSAVNVYLRDTRHLIEVLLVAWFWAVPAVYSFKQLYPGLVHHHLIWLYLADPMAPVVLTFQRVLYNAHMVAATAGPVPASAVLFVFSTKWYIVANLVVLAASVVLFLVALAIFGRLEGNFAEEL
jgi:ABC-2 type transport system permease protein